MTNTKKGLSLADFNAVKAADEGIEFEYEMDGQPTGVWFKVLGSHATKLQEASNAASNAVREQAARAEAAMASSMKGAMSYRKIEEDIESGRDLTVVRLIGWRGPGETQGLTKEQAARFRGLNDPYTPEAAAALIANNSDVANQVIKASNGLGRFMKALSPGS